MEQRAESAPGTHTVGADLLPPGTVFAERFRIERQIGGHSTTAVFAAVDLQTSSACVVKVLPPALAQISEARARFALEARINRDITGPFFPAPIAQGEAAGMPYFAMEQLYGDSLATLLDRRIALAHEDTYLILAQVCQALARLHEVGIVHRDIKPQNILLVRGAAPRTNVRLLDFGVAQWETVAPPHIRTRRAQLLGTPLYMSPEQARGEGSLDRMADLWSLAVIAYQCITLVLPFNARNLERLLNDIVSGPAPTPSGPNVPPYFANWWARATARKIEQRFPSARAFADNLALAVGVTHSLFVETRSSVEVVAEAGGEMFGIELEHTRPRTKAYDGTAGSSLVSLNDGDSATEPDFHATADLAASRPPRSLRQNLAQLPKSVFLGAGGALLIGIIATVAGPSFNETEPLGGVAPAAPASEELSLKRAKTISDSKSAEQKSATLDDSARVGSSAPTRPASPGELEADGLAKRSTTPEATARRAAQHAEPAADRPTTDRSVAHGHPLRGGMPVSAEVSRSTIRSEVPGDTTRSDPRAPAISKGPANAEERGRSAGPSAESGATEPAKPKPRPAPPPPKTTFKPYDDFGI